MDFKQREILFRGQTDTAKKSWVYGIPSGTSKIRLTSPNAFNQIIEWRVIPKTVTQYIGLEDYNKVNKIFEGDIIDYTDIPDATYRVGLLVYDTFNAHFGVKRHNTPTISIINELIIQDYKAKAIGNIFENQELFNV